MSEMRNDPEKPGLKTYRPKDKGFKEWSSRVESVPGGKP
jgi:hypothetical protein